jgi:hypothetical protein
MLVFVYENRTTEMEDVEKGVIVEYVDKCVTRSAAHWMMSRYPLQEQRAYLQHSES